MDLRKIEKYVRDLIFNLRPSYMYTGVLEHGRHLAEFFVQLVFGTSAELMDCGSCWQGSA